MHTVQMSSNISEWQLQLISTLYSSLSLLGTALRDLSSVAFLTLYAQTLEMFNKHNIILTLKKLDKESDVMIYHMNINIHHINILLM